MKNFIDVHNHCVEFSPDAGQALSDRIAEAKDLGLAGICMTDHYDKAVISGIENEDFSLIFCDPAEGEWIFRMDRYAEFLKQAIALEEKSGSRFKILRGIELGYDPRLSSLYKDFIEHYSQDLDLVLLSLHELLWLGYKSVYNIYTTEGRNGSYSLYLRELSNMLLDMPYVNVVGHFDYISRYNKFPHKKLLYKDFPDEFDTLFKTMIDLGIALEINTGTQYKKEENGQILGLPDRDILLRYKELGGDRICLASDAHYENTVGRGFEENVAHLQNLGFHYICHFENRKPVFTSIL